eukprot:6432068-Amphidinium_carterae.2
MKAFSTQSGHREFRNVFVKVISTYALQLMSVASEVTQCSRTDRYSQTQEPSASTMNALALILSEVRDQ